MIYLGALVGAALIYFSFHGTQLDRIWISVQQLKFPFIAAGMVFIAAEFVLRAYRWKLLLGEKNRLRLDQLFSVLMIGYLSNNVIPLRMGELIRAQFLGSNYQVNRIKALATIVVERVFDVIMLVLLFGLCLVLHDAFPVWVKRGGFLAAVTLAAALPVLYV